MSNLKKTLAVMSLLAPASALPLGIGDIELHSALNQRLNAEIKLHLGAGENPADVHVRLASPEKFDQAGVPWSYSLSKLKLELVGSVIKVTTKDVMTEPFLDFLLEVTWPQGNQYREFTVLIDPPAAYNQAVIPAVEQPSYAASVQEDYERPVRKPRAAAHKPPAVAKVVSSEVVGSDGQYGPTRNADNLWTISARLGREKGASTEQMMVALYSANPSAFANGNINALKKGVTLQIPETRSVLKLSRAEANREFQAFASGEKVVKSAAVEPVSKVAADNKQLELVAPTDAKIPDTAVITGQVKAGSDASATGQSASTGLAPDGKAGDAGALEMQARVDKLEKQIGMMQQLITLKDQQLSALQANDKAAAEQAAKAVQGIAVDQQQPLPESKPQATGTESAVTTEPVPTKPVVTPPPTPKPVEAPKPAVAEDDGLFSSEPYVLGLGGLAVAMLSVLGWLWRRKVKTEQETNVDSMFASASEIRMPGSEDTLSMPVVESEGGSSYAVGTVGESSFLSEFTPSDFDAFDTDQNEVDPLSEADVYLAYGRYQQAEDLIRHAISEQPNRDECKLKLLEIFYANENKAGFASYVDELVSAGKQADRAFWGKVTDMGKEILPESVLFGGSAVSQPESKVKEDVVSATSGDLSVPDEEMRLHHSSNEMQPKFARLDNPDEVVESLKGDVEASGFDVADLDFDLGNFAGDATQDLATEEKSNAGEIESMDFDLGAFSMDTDAAVEAEAKSGGAEEIESFEFNFDASGPADSVEEVKSVANEELESFDFGGFGENVAEEINPDVSEAADAPEFDFNFDFDAPSATTRDDGDMDFGVADLTDMDEFETKIDLAKAYVDMGDAEAARSIALEVVAKGSAEQKQVAQALLDELK